MSLPKTVGVALGSSGSDATLERFVFSFGFGGFALKERANEFEPMHADDAGHGRLMALDRRQVGAFIGETQRSLVVVHTLRRRNTKIFVPRGCGCGAPAANIRLKSRLMFILVPWNIAEPSRICHFTRI